MLAGGGWFKKVTGGRPVRAVVSPLTRCDGSCWCGSARFACTRVLACVRGCVCTHIFFFARTCVLLCVCVCVHVCVHMFVCTCASLRSTPHSSSPTTLRLQTRSFPAPQTPNSRCLNTATNVLKGLPINATNVEELCRETLGEDTCDARRSVSDPPAGGGGAADGARMCLRKCVCVCVCLCVCVCACVRVCVSMSRVRMCASAHVHAPVCLLLCPLHAFCQRANFRAHPCLSSPPLCCCRAPLTLCCSPSRQEVAAAALQVRQGPAQQVPRIQVQGGGA
jgi:hypothetical protein